MSYLMLIAGLIGAVLIYAIFRRIALVIGIVIAVLAFSLYQSSPSKSMKIDDHKGLIVGVSADFPPFTFLNEQHQLTGFDVDLIKEIGHRMDMNVELQNMPFSSLLPALQLGRIQAICSGLTATPERAKHVLFTTPYLEGNPLIIVSRASEPYDTVESLHGKEVVVNAGYTADLYMSKITDVHVRRLKSVADAFLAFNSSRTAAFVTAQNTVKSFFEKKGMQQYAVATIPDTDENASIAVSPKCPDLLTKIQAALDVIKQDGSLKQLKNKWKLE